MSACCFILFYCILLHFIYTYFYFIVFYSILSIHTVPYCTLIYLILRQLFTCLSWHRIVHHLFILFYTLERMLLCFSTLLYFTSIALLYYASFTLCFTLYFILPCRMLSDLYCSLHNSTACACMSVTAARACTPEGGGAKRFSRLFLSTPYTLGTPYLYNSFLHRLVLAILNINIIVWTASPAPLKGARRYSLINFHQGLLDLCSSPHRHPNASLL